MSSTRNPWMPSCSSPLWNIPLDISCNIISSLCLLVWLMLLHNPRILLHCSRTQEETAFICHLYITVKLAYARLLECWGQIWHHCRYNRVKALVKGSAVAAWCFNLQPSDSNIEPLTTKQTSPSPLLCLWQAYNLNEHLSDNGLRFVTSRRLVQQSQFTQSS